MMRHLMQLKNYKNVHFRKINNLTINFNNTLGQNILANQAKGINFYDENLPTFEIERFNNKSFNEIAKIAKQNHSNFKQLSNIGRNRRSYYNVVIDDSKMIYLDTINNQIIDLIEDNLEYENPDKIYIPTLRTAHSLYNYKEEKYLKIEDDIFIIHFKEIIPLRM
ncbi:hypothetical protein [Chryseobacterium sp. 3008163]|uniref:hypothetical protein n=1 Tax=Chryseobacterium sp. 3008163 TaxID=2478663 RepID=UPI000F0C08EE|nr:hypothetical protein [Chryseobacterium sp. 3008163]AYN00386.1 hypothetical protein EAG08_08725 [Chryseobacterium sp. 3008163]